MSARNAPLVVSSVEDIRAAMNGDAGSWQLTPEDFAAIERLPSIYALCFDSVQSYLAAELYTEDAELHMGGPPSIGKDAIRKSFEGQAKLRADGKMRLRSRHHMSNIVIRPDPDVPGLAHCVAYMINFRNPDSVRSPPPCHPTHHHTSTTTTTPPDTFPTTTTLSPLTL